MLEVPCVCVSDLTDQQVKALRIIDNKTNESPWDMDFLSEELEELNLSEFSLDFGYGVRKVCEYRSDSNFEKTYGFFTF